MPRPAADPATGLVGVDVVLPAVEPKRVWTAGPAAPRRFVAGVTGLRKRRGGSDHALVQFHEPNDVVMLDLGDGSVTLLASHVDLSALLGTSRSLAAKDYSGLASSERKGMGYVYTFARGRVDRGTSDNGPSWPAPVLLDSDRDGTPDSLLELDEDEWVAQGWSDLDSYVDPWLD